MNTVSIWSAIVALVCSIGSADAAEFRLFEEITSANPPRMIAYTPNGLDPRNPANQVAFKTSELRADLTVLREAFDGLVLYGYNESTTPRILSLAKELKYRTVLLGIWELKSSAEIDGVVREVELHRDNFALGVLVGNEGLTFGRYERDDLMLAEQRLRARLPKDIPLATSEPLVGYKDDFVCAFGDFMAPNIHPVFDARSLGPKESAEWARARAAELAAKTGKPVLLKETGFPHAGEPKFSPESQAEFWRAYTEPGLVVKSSDRPGAWLYHGVGFEAFDLPWKAEASGLPIEKSWGLYSVERKPYPALDVWKRLVGGRSSR